MAIPSKDISNIKKHMKDLQTHMKSIKSDIATLMNNVAIKDTDEMLNLSNASFKTLETQFDLLDKYVNDIQIIDKQESV